MARKRVNASTLQSLAVRVIDYLAHDGLWNYVKIYAGGKKFESNQSFLEESVGSTRYHIAYYVCDCANPQTEVPKADQKTIAISFTGPLATKLHSNNPDGAKYLYELSEAVLHKYGLYLEKIDATTVVARYI